MPRPLVCLVAAVARDNGIGLNGKLLVRLPEDMRRFKQLTLGAPVVMGRKTWESIGRPLPDRHNIVLSRDVGWSAAGATRADSFDAALTIAGDAERLFVLGGAAVYALTLPLADELELTEVDAAFPADTFFPAWNRSDFRQTSRDDRVTDEGLRYAFASYRRLESGSRDVE
jgi:dihydrofolate reductase